MTYDSSFRRALLADVTVRTIDQFPIGAVVMDDETEQLWDVVGHSAGEVKCIVHGTKPNSNGIIPARWFHICEIRIVRREA